MWWNKINCGFSVEEETAHFGTRILAQSDSNVYEAKTLATIEKDEGNENITVPTTVTAYFHSKVGLCISLDNSLVLLNLECNEKLANCDFNHEIQCFCLTDDGRFILVLLRNGDLVCIFKDDVKKQFVRHLPIEQNQGTTGGATIFLVNGSTTVEIVICVQKTLLKIDNLDWETLNRACEKNEVEVGQLLIEEMKISSVEHNRPCNKIKYALLSTVTKGIIVFTERSILHWRYDTDEDIFEYPLPAPDLVPIKVEELDQLKLLFCLTDGGDLITLCHNTFTVLCRFSNLGSINHLSVLQSTLDPSIMVNCENRLICIGATDFKIKFDLALNSCASYLASNQNDDLNVNNGFFFLEVFSGNDWCKVNVRIVEEVQPEFRFERLLRRGKFCEAEKFAEAFGLDLEMVYKAKAAHMLEALQPWTKSEAKPLEGLIELLDKIEDITFAVGCCLNAITPELEMTNILLTYSYNRLKKAKQDSQILELQSQVSGVIMRLHTYQQLYSKTVVSPDHWLVFSKTDLLAESCSHLKKGEVKEASLIWSRHRMELARCLQHQLSSKVYLDIPEWVSVADLLPWLCQFLSVVLTDLPQLLPEFIVWVLARVRALEPTVEEAWPKVGIQISTDLLKTFRETVSRTDLFSYTSENILKSLNSVENFLSVLHSLEQLKSKHGIVMSYKEFSSNIEDVIFTILDRAPADKVQGLVKSFLYQMLLKHGIDSDVILCYYIKRIVLRLPNWCVTQGGLWEARVSAVLGCIYNNQEYLEGVLCVLKKAAVPWSKTVQSVVDIALSLKHPLILEIRRQQALIPEKLILKKYGCNYSGGFNEGCTQKIIMHIIVVGKEEALQDALSLCTNTNLKEEVYYNFLFHYIKSGQVDKVDRLMKDLDKRVCDRIWYKIGLHLKNSYIREDYLERIKPFLPFVSLITNAGYPLQFLKSSSALMSQFDLKINVSSLSRNSTRKEVLDLVLDKISTEVSMANKAIQQVRKVSRLLDVSFNSALLCLSRLLLKLGKCDMAFELLTAFVSTAQEEEESSEEIGNVILDIFAECLSKELQHHQLITLVSIARICIMESSCPWHLLCGGVLISWQGLLLDGAPRLKLQSQVHSSFLSKKVFIFIQELAKEYISFGRSTNSIPVLRCFHRSQQGSEIKFEALRRFHAEVFNLSKELFEAGLGSLCLNYINMLFYTVLCTFRHPSQLSEMLDDCLSIHKWNDIMNKCVSSQLNLVISRRFDLDLALSLLNFFQPEKSITWLSEQSKSFFGDINRQTSVLLVGMRYCELHEFTDDWHDFSIRHTLCTWRKCLTKLGIILRDPFGEEKTKAVQRLVKAPQVDLPLLEDFCLDARFDFQECIHIYAQHLLLSWEPITEVTMDSVSGSRVMTVKNNADHVLKGLKSALSVVEAEKRFVDYCANTIWGMVNCYYYEIYFVILDFLDYVDKRRKTSSGSSVEQQNRFRHRNILKFLNLYMRVTPPSQEEKVNLFKANPTGNDVLPAVADFRLPFTRLESDPLTVINPELNLETYKIWFKLMNFLTTVNKNELCFRAIHKFCAENVTPAAKEMEGKWCVHLCNTTLMKEIEECIGYITEMEIVCASYYYVLNNLPPGADQVKAAELCHENAKKMFLLKKSDESRSKLHKVQKKFVKVVTIHVLHTHNLARREYVQLAMSPHELISALYLDPSITGQEDSYHVKRPDINKAADEIGTLHQVDTNALRKQLVNRWLLPDPATLDETITSYFMPKEKRIGNIEEDNNLIRACYILSYGGCQESFMYLAKIAFNLKDDNSILHDVSWPMNAQLRALQCLLRIVPPDMMYSLTDRDPENIRAYMKELWFTCQLEQFGCVWSVESFQSCNKILLIQQLLESLTTAIAKVAVHLCISYDIDEPVYWNTLIKFMVDNFMLQELKETLPALENKWHFLDCNILSAAWNYVVLTNLSKRVESRKETEGIVKESINLILRCPSPLLLDIKIILKTCEGLDVTELPELETIKMLAPS